jgi:transcription elongation factor GreA
MADVPEAVRCKIEALKAAALEREAREEIPAEMEAAQAVGPVRENADMYLVAGRAHYVQGRLATLRQRLRALQTMDLSALARDRAGFGSTVALEDVETGGRRTVRLVSPEDVESGAGACSLGSPLGRALAGRKPGEEVEVVTPAGPRFYRILSLTTLFDEPAPP